MVDMANLAADVAVSIQSQEGTGNSKLDFFLENIEEHLEKMEEERAV